MGKKAVKKEGGSAPSPPGSPSPASPKQPAAKKQQNKEPKKEQDPHKDHVNDQHVDTHDHYYHHGHHHEYIVNFLCLLVSVGMIYCCPRPEHDLKKQPGVSFLSLYFSGHLDHISHVTQILLACSLSLFFDVFVVAFHVIYPPHPKFVLSFRRKLSIYLHLTSGISEITCGVIAFTVSNDDIQYYCASFMSMASITHAITAYYQTRVVFGAKGIMVPGYIYAITLHLTNAYRLYTNIDSAVYLLNTFLMLHIYVWCRFFIFFFRVCKMFDGYHYTISITLSGLLLFPFSVGPFGNFGMLISVVTFCVLEAALSSKTGRSLSEKLFREHERYALITNKQFNEWRSELHEGDELDRDKAAAKKIFDKLHEDHAEDMRISEVYRMLKLLNIPTITARKVIEIADANGDGCLSFDEFYRYVWSLGSVHTRIQKASESQQAKENLTAKDKAKIVFQMLDIDDSNCIGLAELDMLLTQWGMPYQEASDFLKQYGQDKQTISFDEFYKDMRPIWDFASTYVYN